MKYYLGISCKETNFQPGVIFKYIDEHEGYWAGYGYKITPTKAPRTINSNKTGVREFNLEDAINQLENININNKVFFKEALIWLTEK